MQKKINVFVFFFVCVCLTSPFATYACGPENNRPDKLAQRQRVQFQKYDTNKSKTITIGEFVIGESKDKKGGDVNVHPFIAEDKNKSGDLSFDEWQVFRKPNYYMTKSGC